MSKVYFPPYGELCFVCSSLKIYVLCKRILTTLLDGKEALNINAIADDVHGGACSGRWCSCQVKF